MFLTSISKYVDVLIDESLAFALHWSTDKLWPSPWVQHCPPRTPMIISRQSHRCPTAVKNNKTSRLSIMLREQCPNCPSSAGRTFSVMSSSSAGMGKANNGSLHIGWSWPRCPITFERCSKATCWKRNNGRSSSMISIQKPLKNLFSTLMKVSVQLIETFTNRMHRLGRLEIHQENVTNILIAAHMFDIGDLVEACCTYIEKQLHPSNCLGIHKFALQHDLSSLTKTAWNYILVWSSV